MPIGVLYCIDKITFLVECYAIGKKHSNISLLKKRTNKNRKENFKIVMFLCIVQATS